MSKHNCSDMHCNSALILPKALVTWLFCLMQTLVLESYIHVCVRFKLFRWSYFPAAYIRHFVVSIQVKEKDKNFTHVGVVKLW